MLQNSVPVYRKMKAAVSRSNSGWRYLSMVIQRFRSSSTGSWKAKGEMNFKHTFITNVDFSNIKHEFLVTHQTTNSAGSRFVIQISESTLDFYQSLHFFISLIIDNVLRTWTGSKKETSLNEMRACSSGFATLFRIFRNPSNWQTAKSLPRPWRNR